MGGLSGFLQYLDDRRQVLERIEARLCALQSTYENHYAEISAVRDSEMEQLLEHAVGDPERLPNGFARRLEAAREQVEQEFRERLPALVRERVRLAAEAESCRRRSSEAERVVRATNVDLDRDLGLHPREFAATVQAAVGSTLTEESIRQYFETMGEELSRQAEAQW